MEDSLALRFLYRTTVGRMALKLLVQPGISRAAGAILDSRASRCLVPYYVRRHGIDLDGIEIPEGGFASFNAFFTRKRSGGEPVQPSLGSLLSPCDGFLSYVRLRKDAILDVKHTKFTVGSLLGDEKLAEQFEDGVALIFRLTPANYHRYGYAAGGRILRRRRIAGELHCVRPVATRTVPVYVRNTREYELVDTEEFGPIVQMEVGALLVGKITNRRRSPGELHVRAGEEKGYFEFGGSTILLLVPKGRIRISRRLSERRDGRGEIPVQKGECVAKAARPMGDGRGSA